MCHMSTEGLSCLLKDCHAGGGGGGGRAPGAPPGSATYMVCMYAQPKCSSCINSSNLLSYY